MTTNPLNFPKGNNKLIGVNPERLKEKVAPWTVPGYHENIFRNTRAMVHSGGKITRVTAGGFGALPYVGESKYAIDQQVAMFNRMVAAGASRSEIWKAMNDLAADYRKGVTAHIAVKATTPPVIEE